MGSGTETGWIEHCPVFVVESDCREEWSLDVSLLDVPPRPEVPSGAWLACFLANDESDGGAPGLQ